MSRNLTVSRLYREHGPHYARTVASVPYIRIAGKWLAAAGIAPGQQITVTVQGNNLQIAPAIVALQEAA